MNNQARIGGGKFDLRRCQRRMKNPLRLNTNINS